MAKSVLRPWTTAESAWNYNEAQGWKSTSKSGMVKDYSKNKLAFLKGWQCEGLNYPTGDGEFFAGFCKATGMNDTEVIDSFHGIEQGDVLKFLFGRKSAKESFVAFFRSDEKALDEAYKFIARHKPETKSFNAAIYKKE